MKDVRKMIDDCKHCMHYINCNKQKAFEKAKKDAAERYPGYELICKDQKYDPDVLAAE